MVDYHSFGFVVAAQNVTQLQVGAMAPLIDAALERTDRRHAQLTRLSHELVTLDILDFVELSQYS